MKKKIQYESLMDGFKEQYINSGVMNIPSEVIDLILKSYFSAKIEELKNGNVIVEPLGESRITARRTNSQSNHGFNSKVVTVLDKSINSEICDKVSKDMDFFNQLKCD